MNETYILNIEMMHSLFNNHFMDAYRAISPAKRRKVLPYIHAIHRRWYYTTLVENTRLSPANMMEAIALNFNEDPNTYPIPTLHTPKKLTAIRPVVLTYSAENHPVVDDLRALLHYCAPSIDLSEDGSLFDDQAIEIAMQLSIGDPHYASFLLEIARRLNLIRECPSIHITRMEPTSMVDALMEASGPQVFKDIVNATIALCSQSLRDSIPVPEHIFTDTFVKNLLLQSIETDEIFTRVFDVMGYDLEDLLHMNHMTLNENVEDFEQFAADMELFSGTIVLGIVLDRFFFTPFGHFLRLIKPFYTIPFEFEHEVVDYMQVCDDPEETFIAFFAPCSSFTLTELGIQFFDVKKDAHNFMDVQRILPPELIRSGILNSQESLETFINVAQGLFLKDAPDSMNEMNIYTFKIVRADSPKQWIHLSVPDIFSLHDLFEQIMEDFLLYSEDDYVFYHDKEVNRFVAYAAPKRQPKGKKSSKKTPDALLNTLDFEHQPHMLLLANTDEQFGWKHEKYFEIEYISAKKAKSGHHYPNLPKVSAEMKRLYAAESEGLNGGLVF